MNWMVYLKENASASNKCALAGWCAWCLRIHVAKSKSERAKEKENVLQMVPQAMNVLEKTKTHNMLLRFSRVCELIQANKQFLG